jgi:hypothetical protein
MIDPRVKCRETLIFFLALKFHTIIDYIANKDAFLTRVPFLVVRALKKKRQSKKVCGTGSFDGSLLPGTLLINNPSRESFVFVQASAFALARWCQLALFADRPET